MSDAARGPGAEGQGDRRRGEFAPDADVRVAGVAEADMEAVR